jgi:hypothetical protein
MVKLIKLWHLFILGLSSDAFSSSGYKGPDYNVITN